MGYFEAGGFCNLQEYVNGEQERLQAADLIIDELYVLMLALKSKDPRTQALQKPSRILKVKKHASGLAEIKFNILDADLQTQVTTDGAFEGGYWLDARDKIIIDGSLHAHSGYFKGYNDDMDRGLMEITDQLSLSGSI